MSRGPINAKVVRSGDTISLATASNSYVTNLIYNGATINVGKVCGDSVTTCMSCGTCKANGAVATTNPITTVGANSSLMTYTITGYTSAPGGNGYAKMASGTPLLFGDYFTVGYVDSTGTAYQWQTGPSISSGFNDTVALFSPLSTTDSDFPYQLWTFVNPVNNQGVFSPSSKTQAISHYNVYYGNPYYLQSIGKALKNGNYQYVTLNNSGYDCIISTQSESKGTTPPTSGGAVDYNTTFVVCDNTGAIPTTSGKDVPVPSAIPPPSSSGGLFGWGLIDFGISADISKVIQIVFYLVVFVIITLLLAFILYILL